MDTGRRSTSTALLLLSVLAAAACAEAGAPETPPSAALFAVPDPWSPDPIPLIEVGADDALPLQWVSSGLLHEGGIVFAHESRGEGFMVYDAGRFILARIDREGAPLGSTTFGTPLRYQEILGVVDSVAVMRLNEYAFKEAGGHPPHERRPPVDLVLVHRGDGRMLERIPAPGMEE